jgi:hypothetical protein
VNEQIDSKGAGGSYWRGGREEGWNEFKFLPSRNLHSRWADLWHGNDLLNLNCGARAAAGTAEKAVMNKPDSLMSHALLSLTFSFFTYKDSNKNIHRVH